MLRYLLLALVIAVSTSPAQAQVFRPKSGTKKAPAEKKSVEKKSAPAESDDSEKTTAKKQPRTAPTKKRVTKKKSVVGDRGRPDDLTPEPEPKGTGKDYFRIWDDDEPE